MDLEFLTQDVQQCVQMCNTKVEYMFWQVGCCCVLCCSGTIDIWACCVFVMFDSCLDWVDFV